MGDGTLTILFSLLYVNGDELSVNFLLADVSTKETHSKENQSIMVVCTLFTAYCVSLAQREFVQHLGQRVQDGD